MSDTLPERPSFTDGQYIGAADMNAVVAYARDETRRLALSGGTWGIATGLALVEVANTTGGVQMFIEPGIAWDGYGRPIVLFSPVSVTPDLFANLVSGNQSVWLRYTATGAQAVSPGFLTCGAGDPSTRIAEGYSVSAGAPTIAQQTSGVIIGGATVADPRDMLIAVDQNASVVLDGSAAHQSFPDDTAVWLIPVGIVAYTAGSPGTFSARSPAQLALSRAARIYMGTVAENLLAADGVIRLRDRQTDNPTSDTDTDLAAAAAIQPSDIAADPNNSARLVGNELVWVEGNMRVTGHARMFGTQLELRDAAGTTGGGMLDVPQFLRRSVAPAGNPGGQDLQICFDRPGDSTGTNRLTIGAAAAVSPDPPSSATLDGAFSELMVIRGDGRVAIGTNRIDDYNRGANNLVVATQADSGISVVSGAANKGNLYFADGPNISQQMDGFISYDHKAQQMTLGAGAGTGALLNLTAAGQTMIGPGGPGGPGSYAANADQLIVSDIGDGSAGITISGGKTGGTATIDFTDDASPPNSGFIQYTASSGLLAFGTESATQMVISSAGNVGIGTTAPIAPLTVAQGSFSLQETGSSIQAMNGTLPSALTLQPSGGKTGFGISAPLADVHVRGSIASSQTTLMIDTPLISSTAALQLSFSGFVFSELSMTAGPWFATNLSSVGQVALTALGPNITIGSADLPRTTLDVRGPGPRTNPTPATTLGNYTTIIENRTGSGNVLALLVDGPGNTDFITFFDQSGQPVASIEGTIGSTSSAFFMAGSASSDFAEAMPRDPKSKPIKAGSIVGVRNGLVSLTTEDAECLFVITDRPAVLGNAPPKDKRNAYEMLSFIGQVPVRVAGSVQPGDFIVASGHADGIGRAVPRAELEPKDLAKIVGQAWASGVSDRHDPDGPPRVNAMVGPGIALAAAMGALLERQELLNESLSRQAEAQAGQITAQAKLIEAQTRHLKTLEHKIERLTAQHGRRKTPAAE
jgi:hypothetical protein